MFYYVATSVLCYDIWFYISHVILHTRAVYPFHAEHHYKEVPQFLDTYVGHLLETPFQSIGFFVPLIYWPLDLPSIALVLCVLNARGLLRHDERGVWLIGNHHLLHHKYPKYNFGEYWIDWLCGTTYPNTKEYRRGLIYF
jgi:Delta7-sterol 5-desaturase